MLTYERWHDVNEDEHFWRDNGKIAFWRGFSSWYYLVPGQDEPLRLCALSLNDGDARTIYLAKKYIREAAQQAKMVADLTFYKELP